MDAIRFDGYVISAENSSSAIVFWSAHICCGLSGFDDLGIEFEFRFEWRVELLVRCSYVFVVVLLLD